MPFAFEFYEIIIVFVTLFSVFCGVGVMWGKGRRKPDFQDLFTSPMRRGLLGCVVTTPADHNIWVAAQIAVSPAQLRRCLSQLPIAPGQTLTLKTSECPVGFEGPLPLFVRVLSVADVEFRVLTKRPWGRAEEAWFTRTVQSWAAEFALTQQSRTKEASAPILDWLSVSDGLPVACVLDAQGHLAWSSQAFRQQMLIEQGQALPESISERMDNARDGAAWTFASAPSQVWTLRREGTLYTWQPRTGSTLSHRAEHHEWAHLRAAMALLTVPVLAVDAQGGIMACNSTAISVLSLPSTVAGSAIGQHLQLKCGDSAAQWQQLFGGCAAQVVDDVQIFTSAKKSKFLGKLSVEPVLDGDLTVLGWMVRLDLRSEPPRLAAPAPVHVDQAQELSLFRQRLLRAVASCQRHGGLHVLASISLQDMRATPKAAPALMSPQSLETVESIIRGKLRARDSLVQVPSENTFTLLLEHCPEPRADVLIKEIYQALVSIAVLPSQGKPLQPAFGIVHLDGMIEHADELLAQADIAAFQARQVQPLPIMIFGRKQTGLLPGNADDARLLHDLRYALENNRFRLFIQPIVRISSETGHVAHYEVLLRPLGHKDQPLSPSHYVRIAERCGLAKELDRWVIHYALESCAELLADPECDVSLGLNLSALSITDPELIAFICAEIERLNVQPSRLVFELTETAMVGNLATAAQFIGQLQKLGCQFALDDFGSGSASFSYLRSLPIQYLKIDGSYIKRLATGRTDQAMVQCICDIAKALDIPVIAEHVETQATARVLATMGVEFGQGNYFGSPIPIQHLTRRWSAHS